ncbi:acyl-CoA dehydrogenase [Actinomadura miaoliensis]|uniref:Acyl-CoA oxidase C-terminal domain-containing protein n=1 Tax=Actinomadura miaoliensis TaxID=430685 RepID=A0ABP7VAY3_9ACTN
MATSPPPASGPAADGDLRRFVHGTAVTDGNRALLAEAIPGEFFTYPGGLTATERHALTYRRLRHAGLAAPPAARLLDDPPLLCALLDRAATADPALFHLMLLHYTLALGPVLRFGDHEHHGRDGRDEQDGDDGRGPRPEREALESMASYGALLMTEVGRSNSHLSPRTLARYDAASGDFVLSTPDARAAKFPTNTGHPGLPKTAAIYATLVHEGVERGVFVFVAPLRREDGSVCDGVRIVPAPEVSGLQVDYAAVRLDGLRVPYRAWLRDGARIDADGSFHDPAGGPAQRLTRSMGVAPPVWRAVISMSAAVTRASAAILLRHSADRTTLGRLAPRRALTDYRNQREAVLEALASAYALTAVARRVTAPSPPAPGVQPDLQAQAGGGPVTAWAPWSAVDRDLALLKAAATAEAHETVSRCRVHAGAPGFAATDRLNGYRALAHAYTNAGGDNQLILFDTARAMAELDRYRPPPVAGTVPDEGDLASPRVWSHLARSLERASRERLATRVRAARRDGADAFTAWNDNLALAARTATACADRVLLEIAAEACASDPAVAPLLRLYALRWAERRAGALLNEGVAAAGLLDRVEELRRRVCDEVMPRAAEYAQAFDLPAEITAPASFVLDA